jgi:FkbM family methyltransferase
MVSLDKYQPASIDARFAKWQNLAHQIKEKTNLKELLSPKIIEIGFEGTEGYFVYKPIQSSQKTFKIFIDADDLRAAGISTLANGEYERGVEVVLGTLLENCRTFIDVGANVGFYSCLASSINQSAKVFAFEPNPDVRNRLHKNILLNGSHDRVSVLPFGLGLQYGELELFVPPISGSGAGSLRNLHPEEGESTRFLVAIRQLSEIFPDLDSVDILKMDIEGAELAAITGGFELIQKNKPVIIVELLRKWMKPFDSHPQDVLDLLIPLGYNCFAIAENGLNQIVEVDESTAETNFLFFPNERDQRILEQLMVMK